MPFEIVCHDINQMEVDAIVNAANNRLAKGGAFAGRSTGRLGREHSGGLSGEKISGAIKAIPIHQLPAEMRIDRLFGRWYSKHG